MPFAIRTAAPADRDRVDEVLAASYGTLMAPAYEPAVFARALPLLSRSQPALLAGGTFYLADTPAGAVAGCGGWSLERPGAGGVEDGSAFIRHMAVHPDWTMRGVGRLLYRHCERAARERGARRFEVFSSLNAERFYRALGFATVASLDLKMAPGIVLPALVMERAI